MIDRRDIGYTEGSYLTPVSGGEIIATPIDSTPDIPSGGTISRVTPEPEPITPTPLQPIEIISPITYLTQRSLTPFGGIITIISPEDEQEQRLIDFGGTIGAVDEQGLPTEGLGETIVDIGKGAEETIETVGDIGGGILDFGENMMDVFGSIGKYLPIIVIGVVAYFVLRRK